MQEERRHRVGKKNLASRQQRRHCACCKSSLTSPHVFSVFFSFLSFGYTNLFRIDWHRFQQVHKFGHDSGVPRRTFKVFSVDVHTKNSVI